MSLYNALFGVNPNTKFLLTLIGIDESEIPRFRNVFVNEDGTITVHTRTGGGNRECYADGDDHEGCYHTMNDLLAAKPNYLNDYDDDFDSTYANFQFKVLPEFEHELENIEKGIKPSDQWRELFATLAQKSPQPKQGGDR